MVGRWGDYSFARVSAEAGDDLHRLPEEHQRRSDFGIHRGSDPQTGRVEKQTKPARFRGKGTWAVRCVFMRVEAQNLAAPAKHIAR